VVLLCNAAERSPTSDAVVPEDGHGNVQHGLSKADQAVLHKYTHGADARATIVSMPQVPPRMPGGGTSDDSASEVPPPMPSPGAHTTDDEKARNVAAKSAADAEAAKTAKKEAAIEAAEEKAAQQEAKKETGHASTYKPTPFAEWPEYAKRCVQEYGGYACKPPENAGGCIGCDPGELYGAYTKCSDQYISDACDYGPRNCGSSVCFDPKIAAALRNDKSIILSALQMSSIAYLSQDDKPTLSDSALGSMRPFLCTTIHSMISRQKSNGAWHTTPLGSVGLRTSTLWCFVAPLWRMQRPLPRTG